VGSLPATLILALLTADVSSPTSADTVLAV